MCYSYLASFRLIFCFVAIVFPAFSYATLTGELKELAQRMQTEIPAPVGEIIRDLEHRLQSDAYTAPEKAQIAAEYVLYLVRMHQTSATPITGILESLKHDSENGAAIKIGLARMYGIDARYDLAHPLFDELLASPSLSPRLQVLTYIYLMITNSENQVFVQNASLLESLNTLMREHDLPNLDPLYHYAVADYYHAIRSLDIALEHYLLSLPQAQARNDWILASDNLYSIGILYRNKQDYAKAIDYFERTANTDSKLDSHYGEYIAMYGKATVFFRWKKFDEALAISEDVLKHPYAASYFESELYKYRAKAFLSLQQFKNARIALENARRVFDENRTDEVTTWRAELQQIASEITAAQGDFKTAFEQYVQFHQDYIEAKKYEDLELLESSKLVNEIALEKQRAAELEAKNEAVSNLLYATEAAEESHRKYNQWLVIFIIMAFITVVIMLTQLRKIRATNRLYAEAKEKAELHNQLKSAFISNISHEIRTPLNAIIGFGQVLTEKLENTPHQRLTSQIVNSSDMLLQLINDLLDFSKIEAGKLELDENPCKIRHSLRKLGDIFHAQATAKKLKFTFTIDSDIPPIMIFDELRVKQVLANLIANAIKFSNEGDIHITLTTLALTDNYCRLRVSVADTGIGITTEQQRRLFEPFMQAESSTARKFGGSGLGLHICQQLLALMGSKLRVNSEPGKGATFYFELNLPVANTLIVTPSAPAQISSFEKTNVLLVEDNDINVEVIQAMLSTTNLTITRVENGRKALQRLSRQTFDLVMMDIQMPEMDGYEATQIIRESLQLNVPIVALTANAMQQDIDACEKAGMNAHVGKPIEKQQLIKVLSEYLGVAPQETPI